MLEPAGLHAQRAGQYEHRQCRRRRYHQMQKERRAIYHCRVALQRDVAIEKVEEQCGRRRLRRPWRWGRGRRWLGRLRQRRRILGLAEPVTVHPLGVGGRRASSAAANLAPEARTMFGRSPLLQSSSPSRTHWHTTHPASHLFKRAHPSVTQYPHPHATPNRTAMLWPRVGSHPCAVRL